jgi:hypothetical protein
MAFKLGGTMIVLVLALVVLSLWIAQQPQPILHTVSPPIPAQSGGGCYPSVCHDVPAPTPRQLTPFPRSSGLRNDATTA